MQLNELKIGDICLFSALDDKLSQMIAHLTDSNISHAALCYDHENIMEEVESGVQKNPLKERFKGRTVYIQRLKTEQTLDFQPVLQKANYFLEQHEPYNFADLYLAGILLLAKNTVPDIDHPHTLTILKHLTAFLINEYNHIKNPDKIPMVCSQFVVACYNAGGQEYQLDFKNTCLGVTVPTDQPNNQQNHGLQSNPSPANQPLSLLDKVLANIEQDTLTNQSLQSEHQTSASDIKTSQEIAQHVDGLYTLLTNPATDKADTPKNLQLNATNAPKLSHELTTAIIDFAHAHYQAHHASGEDDTVKALQSLKRYYAGFITPFDLYQNTTNLIHVGILQE